MPTPKKGPRLASSPAHERLMLANMATSLFQNGRITTTLPKAKRLRPLAERLITFAKRGDLHNQVSFPFLRQQGLQEIVVFHKRHYKSVRCGVRKGLSQPCAGFLALSQLRIGCPAVWMRMCRATSA